MQGWRLICATKHLDQRRTTHLSTFSKWYRSLWEPASTDPPYSHVCQLGDPVLRSKAEEIPPDCVKTPEIQKVIRAMKSVLKNYKAVGLSAPQIGVPLRIMLVHFDHASLNEFPPEIRTIREMATCPLTVIINPTLCSTSNTQKIIFTEGCYSIIGFSASIPRFREIQVSGLNEDAEDFQWRVKGWLARIVQHEMDHLEGKVITDIMDPQSFQCDFWYAVNESHGKYRHSYRPK